MSRGGSETPRPRPQRPRDLPSGSAAQEAEPSPEPSPVQAPAEQGTQRDEIRESAPTPDRARPGGRRATPIAATPVPIGASASAPTAATGGSRGAPALSAIAAIPIAGGVPTSPAIAGAPVPDSVPAPLPDTIGGRVAYYRNRAGLSQVALGQATGVSQAAISQIESGGRPLAETVEAIARALGISVALLYGERAPGVAPEDHVFYQEYLRLPEALRQEVRYYAAFRRDVERANTPTVPVAPRGPKAGGPGGAPGDGSRDTSRGGGGVS